MLFTFIGTGLVSIAITFVKGEMSVVSFALISLVSTLEIVAQKLRLKKKW